MIFKTNHIKDAKDITISHLFHLVKNFKELDKDSQNLVVEFLLLLFIK